MTDITGLLKAKQAKNDEFYTRYKDIEDEIDKHYNYNNNLFKNKIIICPCDDYNYSQFTKYFINNYKKLKYKKLICTSFNNNYKLSDIYFNLFYEDNIEDHGRILTFDGKTIKKDYLNGSGDFRTKEIISLINKSDFVITNPPFSLLEDFYKIVRNKKFLFIGPVNFLGRNFIVEDFKKDKVRLGYYRKQVMHFDVLDKDIDLSRPHTYVKENGKYYGRVGTFWFTNINMPELEFLKFNEDTKPEDFDKIDGTDIINIPEIKLIPKNYFGKMAVPITIFRYYNKKQFKVYGKLEQGQVNGKNIFIRIIIGVYKNEKR